MITQSAISPASSRAHRCSVTASLNVLLSSRTLVTAVTVSSRLVMAATGGSPAALRRRPLRALVLGARRVGRGRADPRRRAAGGRGDDEHRRVAGQVGRGRGQRASTGPSAVRIRQLAVRGFPVRSDGGELRLHRGPERQVDERGSGLPVAYPDGDPSSAAAWLFARLIVPSCSSRNSGTGACWNTACSSRRSVRTASGRTSAALVVGAARGPGRPRRAPRSRRRAR